MALIGSGSGGVCAECAELEPVVCPGGNCPPCCELSGYTCCMDQHAAHSTQHTATVDQHSVPTALSLQADGAAGDAVAHTFRV